MPYPSTLLLRKYDMLRIVLSRQLAMRMILGNLLRHFFFAAKRRRGDGRAYWRSKVLRLV